MFLPFRLQKLVQEAKESARAPSLGHIYLVLFFCYIVIFLCTRNLLVGQSRCVKILALEHRYKLLNVERKGSKRPRENAPEVGDGDGEPAPKAGAKSKAKASAKKKKNEE